MRTGFTGADRFALIRSAHDAHTLGIHSLEQLLEECGIRTLIAERDICDAAADTAGDSNGRLFLNWLHGNRISVLGYSHRLDPEAGVANFGRLINFLAGSKSLATHGGPVRAIYFAGLPMTCDLVLERFPLVDGVFRGDETPGETLDILGIPRGRFSSTLAKSIAYDADRLAFADEVIKKADYFSIKPVDRNGCPKFGLRGDSVVARIEHGTAKGLPPLMRAHVGPYLPDAKKAFELFLDWTIELARTGLLDVLSIGTSQLSQSSFGEDWNERPNGGGVPVNSAEEYERIWQVARPMLVRTYAGTKNIEGLARMYEERLDMAWHALSLWWFCRIDDRGPNTVRDNLHEHAATLRYIASSGKPVEPNVPHHFAFRGCDDVTYVVTGYIAARYAKTCGIRRLILQIMLNTPKYTWGVQDLAKARALLTLVRELEDGNFKAYLQPRGGLDYFSHDMEKAKRQLAAVTALMDDIEPHDPTSPHGIHVVSYSEGRDLADPAIVNESIQITRHALNEYRRLRRSGAVDDMSSNAETEQRTAALLADARATVAAIESSIAAPYTPEGLYEMLAAGFFALPYLSSCRDEFENAVMWKTRLTGGSIKIVGPDGSPLSAALRLPMVVDTVNRRRAAGRHAL